MKSAKKSLPQGTLSKMHGRIVEPPVALVAQYGDVVIKFRLITAKTAEIKLPELLQLAAIVFLWLV